MKFTKNHEHLGNEDFQTDDYTKNINYYITNQ